MKKREQRRETVSSFINGVGERVKGRGRDWWWFGAAAGGVAMCSVAAGVAALQPVLDGGK